MSLEALPCVVCGSQLVNVFDDVENQPSAGLAFTSHGHYGSTSFDPMDGQYLELNICDGCLVGARDNGHVLVGRDKRPVVTRDEFGRVLVGYQRTPGRLLTFWEEGTGERDEKDVLFVEPGDVGRDTDDVVWMGRS